MSALRVLVIDDEEDIRHMLTMLLQKEGYEVDSAEDGETALEILSDRDFDLALCDVRMPGLDGMQVLERLEQRGDDTTVIAMSAFGDRELAIDALRRGAYDYIDKPFNKDEILLTLLKAQERLELKRENEELKQQSEADDFPEIIGQSDAIEDLLETIRKVAEYKSTVLITGESGTGKELVARALHRRSPRSDAPWVAVNCGAIPESLLESELFGHVKGAFTDAGADKAGLFEEADGGTLFLDEIGEMPMNLQVKLLRALQEGEIRRIGENTPRQVDVRVLAASNQDLDEMVDTGEFREDLYYRLNVIQLHLPPLRERIDDLPLLVDHFIESRSEDLDADVDGISSEAIDRMTQYRWPGNIRELQNCVERGVVLADGDTIDLEALPERIRDNDDPLDAIFHGDDLSIKKMSEALERVLIRRALEKTDGNRTHASDLLEISHRTLLYKMEDYGLEDVGKGD